MSEERRWDVLLIGGASGVGKTSVSYRLARHFGIGITEVDDFQVVAEHVTTPEQFPVFHLFRTDPERFAGMSDDEKLEHAIAYATAMAGPLEQVIRNHLEWGPPLILEGDFIHPDLARPERYGEAGDRVRGLFIYEDQEQIGRNFLSREGEPQPDRAQASWRYSEWLRSRAEQVGAWEIPARPWNTVFERSLAALAS